MSISRLFFSLWLIFSTSGLHADFDQAVANFSAGKYAEALQQLQPLADKGDARSQYSLGVMYENGFGVEKNPQQAAAWYLKAAKQGNSDAQYNLGAMYEHGLGIAVDYAQAARWYRPAAEQGDLDALNNLGVLYQKGQGVKQDKVLALALFNVSVAYDPNKDSQAARNRQGLAAAGMKMDDAKKAMALTDDMLKPDNFKSALEKYLQQ